MTPIIAVANNKGGVGKTTTTVHIAYLLSQRGVRVLCVDMDTQANLLAHLFPFKILRTAQEMGTSEAQVAVFKRSETLAVLPFSFWEATQTEYSATIQRYAQDYDVILVDCPPSLETRTLAALDVASHILIPTHLERLSVMGLRRLVQEIEKRSIEILGVFPTMIERTSPNQSAWLEQLQANYAAALLDVQIPTSRIFSSAVTQAQTAFEYNGKKKNPSLDAYQTITNTIFERLFNGTENSHSR